MSPVRSSKFAPGSKMCSELLIARNKEELKTAKESDGNKVLNEKSPECRTSRL